MLTDLTNRALHTKLTHAWKNLLFNQFHDILAGCAIESAYTDASYLFGEIMSITDREINRALQAIACKIDTGADSPTGIKRPEGMGHWLVWEHETLGTPLVIFNPADPKYQKLHTPEIHKLADVSMKWIYYG